MGYRGYERRGVEPRIPFGHGLSYTEFTYDELRAPESARAGEAVEVSIRVANTGSRAGQEVVQVYVREPGADADRPDKELRAFAKIDLDVGQAESIRFVLPARAFEHWDEIAGAWKAEPGPREIVVGASSSDLRARAPLEIRDPA
jgi:beta-glucosidase